MRCCGGRDVMLLVGCLGHIENDLSGRASLFVQPPKYLVCSVLDSICGFQAQRGLGGGSMDSYRPVGRKQRHLCRQQACEFISGALTKPQMEPWMVSGVAQAPRRVEAVVILGKGPL